MRTNRTLALSLTLTALAVVGAGCRSSLESPQASTATARPAADNTTAVCDAFRDFELDHRDVPATESLGSFNAIAAADMTELADRATDPIVSTQLRAVATQISALAAQPDGQTYDEVEQAKPEVFTAGGEAWVALESRCGKAIVPTP